MQDFAFSLWAFEKIFFSVSPFGVEIFCYNTEVGGELLSYFFWKKGYFDKVHAVVRNEFQYFLPLRSLLCEGLVDGFGRFPWPGSKIQYKRIFLQKMVS